MNGEKRDLSAVAHEWLYHEAAGVRLRMAHRVIEWDGWEEGLADSILGPSDQEDEWFKSWEGDKTEDNFDAETQVATDGSPRSELSPTLTGSESEGESAGGRPLGKPKIPLVAKVVAAEKEKEKLLNATGDYCGGRGGELGRRLEAWLTINGDADGRVELGRKWAGDHEEEVAAS